MKSHTTFRHWLFILLFLFGLKVVYAAQTPWEKGEPTGEMIGEFSAFSVKKAHVVFDFRTLQTRSTVDFTGSYSIENQSEATLSFRFVTPGVLIHGVTINGELLRATQYLNQELAQPWKLPPLAPGFEGMHPVHSDPDLSFRNGYTFHKKLSPGTHHLKISYEMKPHISHFSSNSYRQYELAYNLLPARKWSTFGQTKVEVLLPNNWEMRDSLSFPMPEHTKSDSFQHLIKKFPSLSTKAWIFFVRKKQEFLNLGMVYPLLTMLFGLVGSFFILWSYAEQTIDRGESNLLQMIARLALGVLITIVTLWIGYWICLLFIDQDQMTFYWSRGVNLGMIFMTPFASLTSILVAIGAYFMKLRRIRLASEAIVEHFSHQKKL